MRLAGAQLVSAWRCARMLNTTPRWRNGPPSGSISTVPRERSQSVSPSGRTTR